MTAQNGPERQGQSTTTLADGRVVIAGGDAEGTAEIVDPATGVTTPIDARLGVARAYHAAVRLADGNVLIVGGYVAGTEAIEQSAEIFDVPSGVFRKVGSVLWAARVKPTLRLRADGVVEVTGGDAARTTEFYDPATGTFGADPAAPSLITDRSDYAPGETVAFIGRRWVSGETVRLLLREEPSQHGDRELFAIADETGGFIQAEFAPEEHDLGITFHVTATGSLSGRPAFWTFTDAAPASTAYSVSTSSGSMAAKGPDIDALRCDDCTASVVLPFPVRVYDQIYPTAIISSNGNVQFSSSSAQAGNTNLPNANFGVTIFPFWDDLSTNPAFQLGDGVFVLTTGTAPNRQYRIRWDAHFFSTGGNVEFELTLHENTAKFDVVYGDIGGSGSPTIGIQKSGAGPFTQYAGCGCSAGTVVSFIGDQIAPTATSLTTSPNPSVFGQPVDITATVTAGGSAVTTGSVMFRIDSADFASRPVNGSGNASIQVSPSFGSHQITATYSGASSFGTSTASRTQTVNRANTTVSVSSSLNPSTFGQSVSFTALVNAVLPGAGIRTGTVFFFDNGTFLAHAPLSGGSAVVAIPWLSSGAHTITVEYSGDGNFNSSTGSMSPLHTVSKAGTTTAVTSIANPSVFGQSVIFGATVTAVAPGVGTPAGTVQFKDNGAPIGGPVTLSGGVATVAISSLTSGDPAGHHTITADYNGDSGFNASNGTFGQTVNRAPLTVTADNTSKTYGADNPAFRAIYGSFALGQTPDVLGGALTLTTLATNASDVGTYAITPSGLTSSNYALTFIDGTLTVNQAKLSVTADNTSKTYGADNPAFRAIYGSFVLGQTPDVLGGALTLTTLTTNASDVGTYAITPGGLTSNNYAMTFIDGTLTVNQARLTVTADDTSKTYAADNPVFTARYSGFVLGQGPSVLDGTPSFSTPADRGSIAGTYPITPGGLLSGNYAITFVNGTLTINKAPVTVTVTGGTFPYDRQPHAASASLTGGNGIDLGVASLVILYNDLSAPPVNAGTYTVVARFGGTENYLPAEATATITITKAASLVTWTPPQDITYGTPLNSEQFNATASVPGRFEYSPVVNSTLPAGVHTLLVVFTPDDSVNYEIGSQLVPLTVRKDMPTLSWSEPAGVLYGAVLDQTQLNATANVEGRFEYWPAAGTVLRVGTYTLSTTFTPSDALNYEPATATTMLAVDKAVPTLTVTGGTSSYDGRAHPASARLTGIDGIDLGIASRFSFFYNSLSALPVSAGTYSVVGRFDGNESYLPVEATATITITKATPKLSWADPARVPYGTALDITQLNATADVEGTFAYSPAAGTRLPDGVQTLRVTFRPADSANYESAEATVTIEAFDNVAPVLAGVPSDETMEATNAQGEIVRWTAPTALDEVDRTVAVTCAPMSGSVFTLGSTTVTCSATDVARNTRSATFTVTVRDTTAPALNLPGPLTVNATSPTGATVTYSASADDLVDGNVGLTCTPASASLFAAGTTTVSCTSNSDGSGNAATGMFAVTVVSADDQIAGTLEQILAGVYGDAGAFASTLQSASVALDRGNVNAACGSLGAFENQIRAKIGKSLTADQGAAIIDAARQMQAAAGCR